MILPVLYGVAHNSIITQWGEIIIRPPAQHQQVFPPLWNTLHLWRKHQKIPQNPVSLLTALCTNTASTPSSLLWYPRNINWGGWQCFTRTKCQWCNKCMFSCLNKHFFHSGSAKCVSVGWQLLGTVCASLFYCFKTKMFYVNVLRVLRVSCWIVTSQSTYWHNCSQHVGSAVKCFTQL